MFNERRPGAPWLVACVLVVMLPVVAGADPAQDPENYMDMSLESLLNLDVTSVTGAALPWFRNPAAVYTLSSEDIRHTGHQSLAEVLRVVPGMQVARLDSRQWAITARGFNGQFAKNLLVLTDSRLVYDPSFSGVFWDVQDLILEDVDRIEVIRGPGATLWGANAVNGVINITTKHARDTQGLYLTLGGGTEERGFGAARYGGQLGETSYFRVWAKYLNRDGSSQVGTGNQPDRWDLPHGGFRVDLQPSSRSRLTLSGDVYDTERLGESTRVPVMGYPASATAPLPATEVVDDGVARGAHLTARFEQDTAAGHNWSAQTYYERQHRSVFAGIQLDRDIVDLDLRHRRKLGARQELMAGVAWHYVDDRSERGQLVGTVPAGRRFHTVSGFLQDTIALRPQRLSLMVGSKFEHNDFTGVEYQPSARLSWTPNDRHTFWAALSRPVRTPARADLDVDLVYGYLDPALLATGRPSGRFLPLKIAGNPDLSSERLLAYEAGYRVQLGPSFSVDVAGFFNQYHDLINFPRTPVFSGTDFRLQAENGGDGRGYGGEVALNWRASSRWRTMGSYSYMVASNEVETPPMFSRHNGNVRSYLSLTRKLEVNAAAYYTGKVGTPPQGFDDHVRADLGLTLRPSSHLELAVWGQDLLTKRHVEADSTFIQFARSELERGAYAQVTFRR
jgi:iron complex outermembrane receptor protein